MFFIEGTGGYGFQLGTTDFLPDGALDRFEFPLVHGWQVGGTVGVLVTPQIAIVGNYEYTDAQSQEEDAGLIIDEVQGEIDYHTLTGGLRLYAPVGFGRFRAELAVGVVLPFEEETTIDYGPGLEQFGITGRGRRVEEFRVGYGGHGALGYEFPIWGPLYGLVNLKIKVFQSQNDDEETRLTNFVTDFTAEPPRAVDAVIGHRDGEARPQTESVAGARMQLGIGARF